MPSGFIRRLSLRAIVFAWLGAAGAASAESAAAGAGDRARIEALRVRAIAAARAEAAKLAASRISPLVRGRDETAFARILRETEGCGSAVDAAIRSAAMMGLGISRLIDDSLVEGDHGCAIRLAPMMLERWQDPALNQPDQERIRFRAGAFLDAAGKPRGAGSWARPRRS